jgi:hypothetical protein
MLHRVALVRTNVSEELSVSIIRVIRIGELGTTLAVNCNGRKWKETLVVSRTNSPYNSWALELCRALAFTVWTCAWTIISHTIELQNWSGYGRTAKEILVSETSVCLACALPWTCVSTSRLPTKFYIRCPMNAISDTWPLKDVTISEIQWLYWSTSRRKEQLDAFARISATFVSILTVLIDTASTAKATKLRKTWSFHGDDHEEWCPLGCYAVWLL